MNELFYVLIIKYIQLINILKLKIKRILEKILMNN